MKISKRILAVLLACLMTVGMFAVTAGAEGADMAESAYNALQMGGPVSTYQITPYPSAPPVDVQEHESNNSLGSADHLYSNQLAVGNIGSRGDKLAFHFFAHGRIIDFILNLSTTYVSFRRRFPVALPA